MAQRTSKRDKAIVGLLAGKTVEQAAKHAGIGKRTLDRWLKEPDFRRRLQESQDAVFERYIAQLSELTGLGLGRLREILHDDGASTRDWIAVTALILKERRNHEAVEIRERLQEIERILTTR